MNKDYLKKFLNYKVEDFDAFHRKAYPNASELTYKNFKQALQRIEKIYGQPLIELNLKFLNSPIDFFNVLESSDYSHNTNITTFSNVLKLLKIVDYPLHEYNKFQVVLATQMRKNNEDREKDLKEKLGYLPSLEHLKDIVITHIEKVNEETTFQEMKNLILVAMLLLSIPLKLTQYSKMKILFGKVVHNTQNQNYILEDLNGDYYIKSKDISIKILDNHLKHLIKTWIENYNSTSFMFIKTEHSKEGMNNKDLRLSLSSATEALFDTNLTNQDIRQIYMKHLMSLDPDFKQKFSLSHILGYKNTDVLELHQ